jgi:hypothetical protein
MHPEYLKCAATSYQMFNYCIIHLLWLQALRVSLLYDSVCCTILYLCSYVVLQSFLLQNFNFNIFHNLNTFIFFFAFTNDTSVFQWNYSREVSSILCTSSDVMEFSFTSCNRVLSLSSFLNVFSFNLFTFILVLFDFNGYHKHSLCRISLVSL